MKRHMDARFCHLGAALALALAAYGCGTDGGADGGETIPVDGGGASEDGGSVGDADAGASADTGPSDAGAQDSGPADAGLCKKDDRRCNPKNAYAYELCDDKGQWQIKICESSKEVCIDGACKPASCAPEQEYCDGDKLMKCAKDGQSGTEVKDCKADKKICMAGACQDLVCKPDSTTCEGKKVAKCNADGSNVTVQECDSGKVCDDGACVATVCIPGEAYCQQGKAVACNAKQTAFEVVKDCKALGKECDKGECGKKICEPDKTKCDGDKVLKCSAGGTSWLPGPDCTAQSQKCVDGGCAKPLCKGGEKSCDGTNVLTCSADGLKWISSKCASGEICGKGKCFQPVCTLPKKWSADTQTFNYWAISQTTAPAAACDLDGDGKNDNAFGGAITAFATQINSALQDQVKQGAGVLLLEAPAYKTDGTKQKIHVFVGDVDQTKGACTPVNKNQTCDFKLQTGSYDMASQAKGDCPPVAVLDNATIKSGKLIAYGPKNKPFTISLPILLGKPLALNFHKMQVEGSVTDTKSWKTTTGGKLCGAIKKAELVAALNALPDSFFSSAGLPKSVVISLLQSLLKEDIDTDGDGTKDATSAALTFSTHTAKIIGF